VSTAFQSFRQVLTQGKAWGVAAAASAGVIVYWREHITPTGARFATAGVLLAVAALILVPEPSVVQGPLRSLLRLRNRVLGRSRVALQRSSP
jgi:hypothetical protein